MIIPIQNIYYLLCYAWDKLEESDRIDVSGIDSTELVDLLGKVLAGSCIRLLKQGLDRYYVEHQEEYMGVKGKLNFTATIKQNLLPQNKTICAYDEFDYNILHNQIIKTTIRKLLRVENLNNNIKDELHKIFVKLPPISEITIRTSMFGQIRLNRNNYHYDFILKVCRLIHENLLVDEDTGIYKFRDFIRDDKAMARLFEDFVRNFYKLESDYRVRAHQIQWQFESITEGSESFLPVMRTDMVLEKSGRKIIIDTKFYTKPIKLNFEKKTFISENMYQLFSYLKNQEVDNCEGILLYAAVDNDFYHQYRFNNHLISMRSINLNQDWSMIRRDLLMMVEEND